MRLKNLSNSLVAAASLPAALLHELSHALVALPWADAVAVQFDGSGGAACEVSWEDPPDYAVLLAAYAPLWLGTVVGAIGLWSFVTGPQPQSLNDWLLSGALAGYWVVYVAHDPRDRGETDTNTEE